MNIQEQFLRKAINDKNLINFIYNGKHYKNIAVLELQNNILKTKSENFDLLKIEKLKVLKERF